MNKAEINHWDESTLQKKTVVQLKALLKEKGLDVSGRKLELINRLVEAAGESNAEDDHNSGETKEPAVDDSKKRRHNKPEPSSEPALKKQKAKTKALPQEAITDSSSLSQLFASVQEPDNPDELVGDSLNPVYELLGVDLSSEESLYLPFWLRTSNPGAISKQELLSLSKEGIKTVAQLKAGFEKLRASVASPVGFKDFYNWLFGYAVPKGSKTLEPRTALSLWELLLPKRWDLGKQLVAFVTDLVEKESPSLRYVSKDLWQQTLQFLKSIKPDVSNISADDSWPSLLDEFVSHVKAEAASNSA